MESPEAHLGVGVSASAPKAGLAACVTGHASVPARLRLSLLQFTVASPGSGGANQGTSRRLQGGSREERSAPVQEQLEKAFAVRGHFRRVLTGRLLSEVQKESSRRGPSCQDKGLITAVAFVTDFHSHPHTPGPLRARWAQSSPGKESAHQHRGLRTARVFGR